MYYKWKSIHISETKKATTKKTHEQAKRITNAKLFKLNKR